MQVIQFLLSEFLHIFFALPDWSHLSITSYQLTTFRVYMGNFLSTLIPSLRVSSFLESTWSSLVKKSWRKKKYQHQSMMMKQCCSNHLAFVLCFERFFGSTIPPARRSGKKFEKKLYFAPTTFFSASRTKSKVESIKSWRLKKFSCGGSRDDDLAESFFFLLFGCFSYASSLSRASYDPSIDGLTCKKSNKTKASKSFCVKKNEPSV